MEFEPPNVVYDASVLFSFQTAHILAFFAQARLVQAHWTRDIQREWVERSLEYYPDLDRASIEGRRDAMDRAIPDACVTNYEHRIEAIVFPDPDDRHVVAAALECRAVIIVTRNKRHFNECSLAPYGLRSVDPDDLLCDIHRQVPELSLDMVERSRSALTKSKPDLKSYLDLLARIGLPGFASAIRESSAKPASPHRP